MVLFAPYYFNAYTAFQMIGVTDILVGPSNPKTLHPDAGEKLFHNIFNMDHIPAAFFFKGGRICSI